MKIEELFEELKKIGIPVAYNAFPKAVTEQINPPYMVYMNIGDENISGDYETFGKLKTIRVEVYMQKKNQQLEEKVETVIGKIDSDFTIDEAYISEDEIVERIYEFEMEE